MTFLRTPKRYKMTRDSSCYLIPFGGEAERMFTIGHRVHWIYKPAGNIRRRNKYGNNNFSDKKWKNRGI